MAEITNIFTYPIKGAAGIVLERSQVMSDGLRHDRKYMVVDKSGDFISQKKYPQLALVRPRLGDMAITVSAPDMQDLQLPYTLSPGIAPNTPAVLLYGRPASGLWAGSEAGQWFSDYLHTDVDVVATHPGRPGLIKEQYRLDGVSHNVGFADTFGISIVSEASLRAINQLIENDEVGVDRFRPNIVVDGEDLLPFEEDRAHKIKMRDLGGFVVRATKRCKVIDINQQNAVSGVAARRALASRRLTDATNEYRTGLYFGVYAALEYKPNTFIHKGDRFEILEKSESKVVPVKGKNPGNG